MAHPISVTYTIAFVSRDHVLVNIEGFLEDLYLFHDLKVNKQEMLELDELKKGVELHKEFLAEKFMIRDSSGEPLKLQEIRLAAMSEVGEGVHLADLMDYEIIYELRFETNSAPDFLTFSQNFTGEMDLMPAEMLLQVKQENAGTPYSMSLMPNRPETIRFDWENPALSAEASEAEWENWYQQQKRETLGITSYSAVYSFLYIEDREVRHEILIPLATLGQSISLESNEDEFLDLDEQDAAAEAVKNFFLEGNPIEINGVEVAGKVDRLNFYGVDFTDFARQAPRKRVPMSSARVGIILSYPCADPPETVKLTWDRFSEFLRRVDLAIIAFDETTSATLGRVGDDSVFEWENPGRVLPAPLMEVKSDLSPMPTFFLPIVSLVSFVLGGVALSFMKNRGTLGQRRAVFAGFLLVGVLAWPIFRWEVSIPLQSREEITAKEASGVFASLLSNVYGSFQFRDESALYDALATSIHGDLLSDVYVDIQRSLVMQEQGGAISRVGEVEILEGERIPIPDGAPEWKSRSDGFGYQCRWNVTGTVEHWGHIHERTNQYSAVFAVVPIEGSWKIVEFDMQTEERIQFETRLRNLTSPREI